MDFAPVYLVGRAAWRIQEFFHHWYVHGFRRFAHAFTSLLEQLDETFALRITLVHFFEPLYKDYSFVGRFLGVIFRFGRVLIALFVYALIAAVFIFAWCFWMLVPVVIFLEIVRVVPLSSSQIFS